MRVIFLGTPIFSVKVLESINASNHEVVAVVTQTDKVNGRNGKISYSKVKERALELGIDVLQYENISKQGEEELRALNPDIMVTCAYGQILRSNILDICPIINVHASLLPKYRGSSPVQWALINGEKEIGVTIMKTELGIDTGDMILKRSIELSGEENAEEALAKLSDLGSELIVEALDLIEKGEEQYVKQNESESTHCRMLEKADGYIDFSKSSIEIKNFVRGVNPWPGAFTDTPNGKLKIHRCEVVESEGGNSVGEVVVSDHKKGLIVKCGEGYLKLLVVQGENSKAMLANAYLLGKKIEVGSVLGGKE